MKYLVYKVTGGLSHMLAQINNCVNLSKHTGRYLIIDTYYGSFQADFNDYFEIPDFEYSTNYDILYNDESIDNTKLKQYVDNHAEWIEHWNIRLVDLNLSKSIKEIVNSNDDVVFCTSVNDIPTWELAELKRVNWNIKVKQEIVDSIKLNTPDVEYVGVHFRNTDLTNNLDSLIENAVKLNNKNIYFATDDYFAFDELKNKLGDSFNIIQFTKPLKLKEGQGNIHYLVDDTHTMLMNTLIDMYHLSQAKYFIPSMNSAFSKMVLKLREEDDFFKRI
jgi:hypothetical protein